MSFFIMASTGFRMFQHNTRCLFFISLLGMIFVFKIVLHLRPIAKLSDKTWRKLEIVFQKFKSFKTLQGTVWPHKDRLIKGYAHLSKLRPLRNANHRKTINAVNQTFDVDFRKKNWQICFENINQVKIYINMPVKIKSFIPFFIMLWISNCWTANTKEWQD